MKSLFRVFIALSTIITSIILAGYLFSSTVSAQDGTVTTPTPAEVFATPTPLLPEPSISVTPAPVPSGTPAPPIPPGLNHPPVVFPSELLPGHVAWPYTGIVLAVDHDKNDAIKLDINNLPPGLLSVHCNSISWNVPSFSYCFIMGWPTKAGEFFATAVATDSNGAKTEKKIRMTFYVGLPVPEDQPDKLPTVEEIKEIEQSLSDTIQ